MEQLTLSEYLSLPADYRSVWTTERDDLPNWQAIRHQYMGKRTLMRYENCTPTLLIEDLHFIIIG